MNVSEWENWISPLRDHATRVPLYDLLSSNCGSEFIECVNKLIKRMANKHELLLNIGLGSKVSESFEHCGILRDEIESYARRYFDCRWVPFDEYLLQVIIMIYRPDIGLQIDSEVVKDVLSDLRYDDDGLLECRTGLSFVKDGVLTDGYYLQYAYDFYRFNLRLSGGFLDVVTDFIRRNDNVTASIAINPDIILDRCYFFEYLTRAFIRGPQSISLEKLNDPRFPEDRSGTVTEFKRVDDDPIKRLTFEVDKTQFMWSARDNLKTVQIEEIAPCESRMTEGRDYVSNRYVHAIWDITDKCFHHFDGAVRVYAKERYQERLDSDLKHYDGKPTYKKLFRLDSAIGLDAWCDMTARFFYGNELVEEYFCTEM